MARKSFTMEFSLQNNIEFVGVISAGDECSTQLWRTPSPFEGMLSQPAAKGIRGGGAALPMEALPEVELLLSLHEIPCQFFQSVASFPETIQLRERSIHQFLGLALRFIDSKQRRIRRLLRCGILAGRFA